LDRSASRFQGNWKQLWSIRDQGHRIQEILLEQLRGGRASRRPKVSMEAITQKRDVANIRSAASSSDNLAKHRLLLRRTSALSAAEIPRFGVLASMVIVYRCRGAFPSSFVSTVKPAARSRGTLIPRTKTMARPQMWIPKTLEEAAAELTRHPAEPLRVVVNDVELELRLVTAKRSGRRGSKIAALGPWRGESPEEILGMLREGRAAGGSADPPNM
jgi:hypothetical protein